MRDALGDTLMAISWFQKAIDIAPDYTEALDMCGVLYSAIKSPLAIGYFNRLIELNSDILKDGDYVLNFWYNINIGRPDVLAVAEKVTSDTTIWVDQYMVRETNLVVDETWAYAELKFSFKSSDTINILLTSGPSEDWLVVDELLIRKKDGSDLFNSKTMNHPFIGKDSKEYIVYNNRWIDKCSFDDFCCC